MKFSKYQSSGNDLILIEDFKNSFPVHLVARLCHRKFGIGSDGLVLLQRHQQDFAMRFFNPDGKEASQCGNALLCLGSFISSLGYREPVYHIHTKSGQRIVRSMNKQMSATLGTLSILHWDIPIENQRCFVVDTGVPHAVVLQEEHDFFKMALQIRHHVRFQPEGVNVNMAQIIQEKKVKIRTFERGVEGETLSCGTGAAATAFVLSKLFGWQGKIEMVFASNEKIDVIIADEVEIVGEPKLTFNGFFPL